MTHVIEHAKTGRAKCRGCDGPIEKDELRFGERVSNVFGDGETTLWFHLRCAAYKRPESFLDALQSADVTVPDADRLAAAAEAGVAHRRLPRLNGAERAPTGRARCRCCRQPIVRGNWRFSLVFFEEYRFEPSGFIHAECAEEYFGTTDLLSRLRFLTPSLTEADIAELHRTMRASARAASTAKP